MITTLGSAILHTHLQHKHEANPESTFFTKVPHCLQDKLEFLELVLLSKFIFLAIKLSLSTGVRFFRPKSFPLYSSNKDSNIFLKKKK